MCVDLYYNLIEYNLVKKGEKEHNFIKKSTFVNLTNSILQDDVWIFFVFKDQPLGRVNRRIKLYSNNLFG